MRIVYPKILNEINSIFHSAGFKCYLVGGAVRNMALDRPAEDYDLSTNAKPEDVIRIFKHVIPTGIKHGTVTILYKGHSFEATTFRIDGEYTNQRHPDEVHYTRDILEDLKRRDFTINAMALDLKDNSLLDPHKGLKDIKKKIIRAIGIPEDRFLEDGLRLMRACRFAAQLEYKIEKRTREALTATKDSIKSISQERIRDELIKIIMSDHPIRAFEYLRESGILEIILPELLEGYDLSQKGEHIFDIYTHSLMSCKGAVKKLEIKLAALLHDIGKARSLNYDRNGVPTFYHHEKIGAEMARNILQRLKFSRAIENNVVHLIENHMFHYEDQWTDAAVRRFIAKAGEENIQDLFHLRRADHFGKSGHFEKDSNLKDFQERINSVLAENSALSIKDLNVNGNILFKEAGIPKDRSMGIILKELLDTVLDDPSQNNTKTLIKIAKNYYETRIKT